MSLCIVICSDCPVNRRVIISTYHRQRIVSSCLSDRFSQDINTLLKHIERNFAGKAMITCRPLREMKLWKRHHEHTSNSHTCLWTTLDYYTAQRIHPKALKYWRLVRFPKCKNRKDSIMFMFLLISLVSLREIKSIACFIQFILCELSTEVYN
jgi:hypothetical protein